MVFSSRVAAASCMNPLYASVFEGCGPLPDQYASTFSYSLLERICIGLLLPNFFKGHQAQPILFASSKRTASVNQTFEFSPVSPSHTGTLYLSLVSSIC